MLTPDADGRLAPSSDLVAQLVAARFPQWAGLPIAPVESGGWDNLTFRLGDHLAVRLPSAERYVAQIAKEHFWLPRLAPHLPLEIPVPVARGEPGHGYPYPWSVYRWIEGKPATAARIADPVGLARATAAFLTALQGIDATDGPAAGKHNFHRGGPLQHYDAETRVALGKLENRIDTQTAADVWSDALTSAWPGDPVWVHGDIAPGNLLVRDGRLAAVIDFGSCGTGDPACDLVIAWTFLDGDARAAFRSALPYDDATWTRARGWALWKALVSLAPLAGADPRAAPHRHVVGTVIAEHRRPV